MKLSHGLSLLAFLSVGMAGTWLGCSSSTPAVSNPDGGSPPPGNDGSAGPDTSTADTGSPSNPDSGGDTGPGTLSCASYCASITSACTGANQQYKSNQECLNACALFPQGSAADKAGFTLGCKTYHAGVAATTPTPHCWHAGPYGFGGCGTQCESFCALAVGWCSTTDGFDGGAPFASTTACTGACANYLSADAGTAFAGYSAAGPTSGDTMDCREYHLGAAMDSTQGGANQALHCNHVVGGAGTPCK